MQQMQATVPPGMGPGSQFDIMLPGAAQPPPMQVAQPMYAPGPGVYAAYPPPPPPGYHHHPRHHPRHRGGVGMGGAVAAGALGGLAGGLLLGELLD